MERLSLKSQQAHCQLCCSTALHSSIEIPSKHEKTTHQRDFSAELEQYFCLLAVAIAYVIKGTQNFQCC